MEKVYSQLWTGKRGGSMDEVLGYFMVAVMLIGLSYGFINQFQNTVAMRNEKTVKKKDLWKSYIACLSFLGLIFSYLLNILVALSFIHSNIITSDNTSIGCYLFLILLLLAKLKINSPSLPKSMY